MADTDEPTKELIRLLTEERDCLDQISLPPASVKVFQSIQLTFSPTFLELLQSDGTAIQKLEHDHQVQFQLDNETGDIKLDLPGYINDFLSFYRAVLSTSCEQLLRDSILGGEEIGKDEATTDHQYGLDPVLCPSSEIPVQGTALYQSLDVVNGDLTRESTTPTDQNVKPRLVVWEGQVPSAALVPGEVTKTEKTVDIVIEVADDPNALPQGSVILTTKPEINLDNMPENMNDDKVYEHFEDTVDDTMGGDESNDKSPSDTDNNGAESALKTASSIKSEPSARSKRGRKNTKDYESLMPFKFFCTYCSFKSKRKNHFDKHLEVHRLNPDQQIYACDDCDYKTIRLSQLQRHKITHTVSTEIEKCPMCDYRTTSFKLLQKHVKLKHKKPTPKSKEQYKCNFCSYSTNIFARFERHLRCHSDGPEEKAVHAFQCPKCIYQTKCKEHIVRHIKNVHSDERPYLCDLCGKAFKRPDGLKVHKEVHQSNRLKRFACRHCQKRFRSKTHLNEHLRIHSEIRAFLCEICGAPFKTRSVQRKHEITIHQQPRSFSCPNCTKCFNTKFALQRHIRSTHAGVQNPAPETLDTLGTNTPFVQVLPLNTVDQYIPVANVQGISGSTLFVNSQNDLQQLQTGQLQIVPISDTVTLPTAGSAMEPMLGHDHLSSASSALLFLTGQLSESQ